MTVASFHAPRWRRIPEERPHQILAAAIEVFGEHGLSAARIDDIARRAGVSKGTIYLYFPTKEALFQEMVRQTIIARIELSEQNVSALHTATEQITVFLDNWWTALRSPDYLTVFRLVLAEMHHFPELTEFYSREVVLRAMTLLSGLIERGVANGEFRPVDPVVTARILSSMCASHALWIAMRHCALPPALRVTEGETLQQLLDFFFSALRPRGAPVPPLAPHSPS
jgi:AcrR family transcriptional regulator